MFTDMLMTRRCIYLRGSDQTGSECDREQVYTVLLFIHLVGIRILGGIDQSPFRIIISYRQICASEALFCSVNPSHHRYLPPLFSPPTWFFVSLKDTFLLFSISKMGHKSELMRDTAATQLIQRG